MNRPIRIAALFFVLGTLPSLSATMGRNHHLVSTSKFDDIGTVYSPAGKSDLELREIRTQIPGANGKSVTIRVLVLFEPHTGAFSWRAFGDDSSEADAHRQSIAFREYRAAFLKDAHLIQFLVAIAPTRLIIQESTNHASNLDDAQRRALQAANESIDPSGNWNRGQRTHEVSLFSLGVDFVSPPMSSQFGPTPKVTDVRWDGQHWLVILRAQWTEEIALDEKYNLVSMRRVE